MRHMLALLNSKSKTPHLTERALSDLKLRNQSNRGASIRTQIVAVCPKGIIDLICLSTFSQFVLFQI